MEAYKEIILMVGISIALMVVVILALLSKLVTVVVLGIMSTCWLVWLLRYNFRRGGNRRLQWKRKY